MNELTKVCGYEVHPAAAVFPIMDDWELDELATDIKTSGQRRPVLLHQGLVIDGRNRLLACERAGITPTVEVWRGTGVVSFIVSENVARRHLTPSQRAVIAMELLPQLEAEAKERRAAGLKNGRAHASTVEASAAPGRQRGRSASAAEAAAMVGASVRSVERAKAVAKVPELAAKVKSGEVTLKQAEKQIRNPRQAAPRHPKEDNNERYTPRTLILARHKLHGFTIDVASDPRSPAAKVIGAHWTKKEDGLKQSWNEHRVWCNPPFDEIPDWVKKAHREVRIGCELVEMIIPATRTEQPFWQELVEPQRDGRERPGDPTLTTVFLGGRTKYGNPEDPEGIEAGSPSFGSVLLTWKAPLLDRIAAAAKKVSKTKSARRSSR